ncbi:MAG: DUF3822 family protein [bacterium]
MKFALDYIASDFAVDLSKQYSLSIRQNLDGYSFCVIDKRQDKCVAIKSVTTSKSSVNSIGGDQLFEIEPLLKLEYDKVIFFGEGAYALVPNAIISDNNLSSFLSIEKRLQNRAKLLKTEITEADTIVCYTNQWQVPNIQCVLHHSVEPLLQMGMRCSEYESVWCEITNHYINIAIIKNSKIILVNSYQISSKEDIYYYILACYQQFGISVTDVRLHVTGRFNDEKIDDFLKEYIKGVDLIMPKYWNNEFDNIYAPDFTLLTEGDF